MSGTTMLFLLAVAWLAMLFPRGGLSYPVYPFEGLNCYWYRYEMATSDRWIQTCSDESSGKELFLLEFWYQPGRTIVAECKQGHPYVPNLLQYYDTAEFDTYIFLRCPLPEDLDFSNILENIDVQKFGFSSYRNLETLNMSLFDGLKNVENLDFKHNGLQILQNDMFDKFSMLTKICLSFNFLERVPSDLIQNLQLTHFDIGDNRLVDLSGDFFAGQTKLETLLLARNKFKIFHEDLFRDLESLRYLDLTQNNIVQMSPDHLVNSPILYKIIIRINDLKEIPEGLFRNNRKLAIVDISDNPKLSSIPENIFVNTKNLINLQLSGCNFSSLPENLFSNLKYLNWLHIDKNSLTTLPTKLFDGMTGLKSLSVTNNKISKIPMSTFANLTNLRYLNLDVNQLQLVEKRQFEGLSNLLSLSLASNGLRLLPNSCFKDLNNLQKLSLQKNRISELPTKEPFGPGTKLKSINLSQNKLTEVPILDPKKYKEVNYLNLENNDIAHVYLPILQGDLSKVYLGHNMIRTVNVTGLRNKFGIASSVYLNDNNIVCNCENEEFLEYLRSDPSVFQQFPNSQQLSCAEPDNQKLVEVDTLALNCTENAFVIA